MPYYCNGVSYSVSRRDSEKRGSRPKGETGPKPKVTANTAKFGPTGPQLAFRPPKPINLPHEPLVGRVAALTAHSASCRTLHIAICGDMDPQNASNTLPDTRHKGQGTRDKGLGTHHAK